MKDRTAEAARWAARFMGVMVPVTFFSIAVGEIASRRGPFPSGLRVWAAFILLALSLAGMLLGWVREFHGAVISLFFLALFVAVAGLHRQGVILFAAVPGALYLLSWTLRRSEGT
ncbi:MAG: hypothetical protein JO041_13745 [Acidobacteria bacterium]|nr:hypothetical protein [Acidobacteriota bacterium]